MKNKAVLTLLSNKKEVLKVTPNKVSPKGCEFSCTQKQSLILNEENGYHGRYNRFQLRLGLFFKSPNQPSYIATDCQVASIRRESQDIFKVIVTFIDLSSEACRLIYSFLSEDFLTTTDVETTFVLESSIKNNDSAPENSSTESSKDSSLGKLNKEMSIRG